MSGVDYSGVCACGAAFSGTVQAGSPWPEMCPVCERAEWARRQAEPQPKVSMSRQEKKARHAARMRGKTR